MHDYHAAETLVGQLTDAGLVDPVDVEVRVGAAYSPVALRQAFEMLTLGTRLTGSRLLVETAEDECACPACGASWQVKCEDVVGHVVVCRACGAPAFPEARHGERLARVLHVHLPT